MYLNVIKMKAIGFGICTARKYLTILTEVFMFIHKHEVVFKTIKTFDFTQMLTVFFFEIVVIKIDGPAYLFSSKHVLWGKTLFKKNGKGLYDHARTMGCRARFHCSAHSCTLHVHRYDFIYLAFFFLR